MENEPLLWPVGGPSWASHWLLKKSCYVCIFCYTPHIVIIIPSNDSYFCYIILVTIFFCWQRSIKRGVSETIDRLLIQIHRREKIRRGGTAWSIVRPDDRLIPDQRQVSLHYVYLVCLAERLSRAQGRNSVWPSRKVVTGILRLCSECLCVCGECIYLSPCWALCHGSYCWIGDWW